MNTKKVILITGASSGIGKATAKQLINEGHIVYPAARRVEQMKDLEKMGGIPLKMDVSKDEEMSAGVNRIIKEQGRIDVLLNNAGFGLYGAVEDISIDDARYQMDVCLFGLARLTQLVLPHMRKQKSGTILNTSSMGGKIYTPLGAWYHAAKHAVEGFSDCLRLETKQFGINVVIIEPGIIKTEFGAVLGEPMMKNSGKGAYKEMAQKVASATESAMGEKGSGSDPSVIANVVSKAINARKPKTRYVAGSMAGMLLFIRKWFGDRIYDMMVMSAVK